MIPCRKQTLPLMIVLARLLNPSLLVLIAVMADRNPFSMRLVGWAALVGLRRRMTEKIGFRPE